jgi:hypothetical protein
MQCPQCQHENPEDAWFCNACGAKLETECPGCGHINPPGSRFCHACGHNLAVAPQPDQPEPQPATEPERESRSYTLRHLAEKILTSCSALEGERKQVLELYARMLKHPLYLNPVRASPSPPQETDILKVAA